MSQHSHRWTEESNHWDEEQSIETIYYRCDGIDCTAKLKSIWKEGMTEFEPMEDGEATTASIS